MTIIVGGQTAIIHNCFAFMEGNTKRIKTFFLQVYQKKLSDIFYILDWFIVLIEN